MTLRLILIALGVAASVGCWGGPEMKVVDVTDFGAVPNDRKDDIAGIRAAIAECARHSPVKLVFPQGRYDLFPQTDSRTTGGKGDLFSFSHLRQLTLEGNGSTIMFHGVSGLMGFGACSQVTVKGFVVDVVRAPFSQGVVQSVEGNSFDVKVDKEYPVVGGEPVGAFMDYDRTTGRYLHHGLDEYYTCESTELVGPQILRVRLKHEARVKPGSGVVLRHQVYGNNAFNFYKCSGVKVQDVTVHCIPGMALTGSECTDIDIERLRVVPTPRSGRLMSATADAVHLGGTRGHITMTGCEFDGMGDDAANIKSGLYLTVLEKADERTVVARHNLGMLSGPDPGDTMEMAHQNDMLCYATGTAKSTEVVEENKLKVVFEQPLPTEMRIGDVIGNASRIAKTRISDCVVRNNRARGFLLQNRDVVVEDCRFENVTSGGIWVLTETVYFYESISSRDVTVRNCVFDNCNYGGPLGYGVLCAYSIIEGWKDPPKPGVHRRIVFENNLIRQASNCAIYVSGTDDIVLRGNTVERASDDPTNENGKSAIYIMSSRNVRLERNAAVLAKQGKGCIAPLTLGPGVEKETVVMRSNKGFGD